MSTSDWQGPAIGGGVGSTDGEAGPAAAVTPAVGELPADAPAAADGELPAEAVELGEGACAAGT
jgi:hypothetical protein